MRIKKLVGIIFLITTLLFPFSLTAWAESAELSNKKIDLLSKDADEWVSVDSSFLGRVSKATVEISDDGWKFGNTNGFWPYMRCILKDRTNFNIYRDRIKYDFTPEIQTSLIINFLDKNGTERFVVLNSEIKGALIDKDSGQIFASSRSFTGELRLDGMFAGDNGQGSEKMISELADKNGNIEILGVCIHVIGSSQKTVYIRELCILTPIPEPTPSASIPAVTTASGSTTQAKETDLPAAEAKKSVEAGLTSSSSPTITTLTTAITTLGSVKSGTASVSNQASSHLKSGRANPILAAAHNVTPGSGNSARVVVVMLAAGGSVIIAAYILFFRKKDCRQ